MEGFLVLGVLWAVVLGAIGYWIAGEKNRDGVEGAALGCLLGPLGLIIEAVLPTGDVPSAPVARSNDSTSSLPARNSNPPRTKYSEWQVLYVPFDYVLDPEDSRKAKGADGPPPGWLKFDDKTGTANLIASMSGAEVHYFHERGYRVVEAVWKPGSKPTALAAFGDPSKTYDLMWPDYPRINWSSAVGQDGTSEPLPTADDVPDLLTPVEPARPHSVSDGGKDESDVVEQAASTAADRPTKDCPDCAESILEAARVCRFCRYEFWPADAPRPEPSGDGPEADESESLPGDSTAAEVVADADTHVTGEDAPHQTQPTTRQPPPPAPEPDAPAAQVETPPPPAPPPSDAPPPPSYPPRPPAGQPAPPPYPPEQPYAPPPPGWQPPPLGRPPGQVPPGQGPWPPTPRPPDQPRE